MINNYTEFFPFYLSQHKNYINRILHFIGTNIAIIMLTIGVFNLSPSIILKAIIAGYGFAWVGHVLI